MRLLPEAIGPYRIVRVLGQGGMGVVYEARHPRLPRPVALKLILEHVSDEVALARFGREAQFLAAVKHPNIVNIHELGRSERGPYIVTELVDGEPLEELCREAMAPERAAEIVRALADALAALHARKVLHRDLKPENVLLRRDDGRPVLLDFGLARDDNVEKLTQTGMVLGTPAYMAPEQADGMSPSELDGRVDVYGLGAILYACLSGRAPFNAASSLALMKAVLTEEPEPLAKVRPDLPAEIQAICRVAMAKERERRYPGAAALRDDLDRYLAGEPPEALGKRTQAPALLRGRRPLFLIAGLAVLLLGASVGWAVTREPPHEAPPATPTPSAAPRTTPTPSATPPPGPPNPRGLQLARIVAPAGPPVRGGNTAFVGFLDDDTAVAAQRDRTIRVWSLSEEQERARTRLPREAGVIWGLALRADGQRLAVVSGYGADSLIRFQVFDRALNATPDTLPSPIGAGERDLPKMDGLVGLALHPTRDLVAVGTHGGVVHLIDIRSRETLKTLTHRDGNAITGIGFTPAGETLVAVSSADTDSQNDNAFTLATWDLSRWEEGPDAVPDAPLRTARPGFYVTALEVSPDGRYVGVGFYARYLHLYDVATLTLRELNSPGVEFGFQKLAAHRQGVRDMAFASPWPRLYSVSGVSGASRTEGELRVWDADAAELLHLHEDDRHQPRSVAVSPSGRRLLIGYHSGQVELWEHGRE